MIETRNHEGVLEIVIANPPVNALGAAVRLGLMNAVSAAQTDGAVKAIVIRGAGRLFSAGADITEFGKSFAHPGLPELVDFIESSAKPVVAAIHGMALGGGLEVALACHYRVTTPQTKLGLPEVKLGILPGAGGTQRLPRIVGIESALNMIVSGDPIPAKLAQQMGLIDQIVDDSNLALEAIDFARGHDEPRRTGERAVAPDAAVFDRFVASNERKIKGLDAPAECIEAVRASVAMPLADGLKKERELFLKLVMGAQSKALRHVFFAERAAATIGGLAKDIALRPIKKVGIIGAGTMGGGIAMNFLSAGIPVIIVETAREVLDRGVGIIRKNYEGAAAKGRLNPQQVERAMSLLSPTLEFDALTDCDLVIEAVYENMELKKQIFAQLDAVLKPGAMLASNTSYLNVNEIAAATRRPQDVLGLHFFSPANVMKLVEVVRGAKTAPDAIATGIDLARKIGKIPVVAGVCYGFIGNRMLAQRQAQGAALLLEGAAPLQIDKVHTAFGMPMGPFQMADLAGVDVGWHRDPERIETIKEALCAARRWGQKTKAGYYDYDDKRQAIPSPVVENIINEFRAQSGIKPRDISEEEIVVRTLYIMINEGAKILEEGIAQRANDIDVVWVHGYGWPRHKGGPMFWADIMGAKTVFDALKRYEDRLGPEFSISPLLHACATQGKPLGMVA